MDVTGTINDFSWTDSVDGLADITIIPAIFAWKTGNWQYDITLPVYTPTGDYEAGQFANLGLNYWTFDPTFGMVYSNPKSGFNAALHAGVIFNTEDSDTDYDSGSVLHAEISAQQLLPAEVGVFALGGEKNGTFVLALKWLPGLTRRLLLKSSTNGLRPRLLRTFPYWKGWRSLLYRHDCGYSCERIKSQRAAVCPCCWSGAIWHPEYNFTAISVTSF